MAKTKMHGVLQLHSGTLFDVLDPDPKDVHMEDIARGLAYQCRFNGHTSEFYSVAEHSVRVSGQMKHLSPTLQLAGLMHDAAEAYVGDIVRPIKPLCVGFDKIEANVMRAILVSIGLPNLRVDHPEVKHADRVMLAAEGRDLMKWETWREASSQYDDAFYHLPDHIKPIVPWSPEKAERTFMDAYLYLTDELEVKGG